MDKRIIQVVKAIRQGKVDEKIILLARQACIDDVVPVEWQFVLSMAAGATTDPASSQIIYLNYIKSIITLINKCIDARWAEIYNHF